jgi:hypothetical protein
MADAWMHMDKQYQTQTHIDTNTTTDNTTIHTFSISEQDAIARAMLVTTNTATNMHTPIASPHTEVIRPTMYEWTWGTDTKHVSITHIPK